MFNASENFDIADLKRSSVKMKGALQAEWQEVMTRTGTGSANADSHLDLVSFDLTDDSRAFLPRIDLTLKMNQASNVSYVPTLTNLQNPILLS